MPDGPVWLDPLPNMQTIKRTFTFDGTSGKGLVSVVVPIFNINGPLAKNGVIVERIGAYCITDLDESGGTATIALGVTGNTAVFIAATTATTIDAGEVWLSTTATAGGLAVPAACQATLITANIIGTIATGSVASGVLHFFAQYRAVNDGAYLSLG